MGIFMNVSELPSAELLQFYKVFEDTALGISAIMAPFTIIAMVFTSNSVINLYRLLLINELSWSLLLDIMSALIGAVSLFPLPCYYGVNVSSALSHTEQLTYFVVGIGVYAMKFLSILFQLEYVLARSLAMDSKARALLQMKTRSDLLKRHVGILVGLLGPILGLLIYHLPDQEEQKRFFISPNPSIGKLYEDHPDIICFTDAINPAKGIVVGFVVVSATPFIGLAFLIIMYHSMRKNNWSTSTYRLQLMLFRSLVFQVIAFLLFLCLPCIMLIISLLFELHNGPVITVFCFCFLLMHTPFDCFMILYFIKPYRSVVANLLKALQAYGAKHLLAKCPTATLHQLNEVSRQCNDIHMGTWLNRVTCTFFRHPQHLPPSPTPPILYPSPSYHPTAPSTHEHPSSSRPHHQQHCTPPQDNNQLTALLANLLANTINNQSPYHRGRRGGRGRHYPRGGV